MGIRADHRPIFGFLYTLNFLRGMQSKGSSVIDDLVTYITQDIEYQPTKFHELVKVIS